MNREEPLMKVSLFSHFQWIKKLLSPNWFVYKNVLRSCIQEAHTWRMSSGDMRSINSWMHHVCIHVLCYLQINGAILLCNERRGKIQIQQCTNSVKNVTLRCSIFVLILKIIYELCLLPFVSHHYHIVSLIK